MISRLRIIVSGMISADPGQGGAAWAVLQYVLGLRELGHEVYVVEPIATKSIRPASAPLADSANARYFNEVAVRFGLTTHAALLCEATRDTVGLSYARLRELAPQCDLLINISGMLTDPAILEPIARRVYLDLDPAFNQLWHASGQIDMRFDGHTHFVTVGQAVGQPGCAVPSCDRPWTPTLPPVVLSQWPRVSLPLGHRGWTTVANWRAYGSIQHGGVSYGQKAHSLRRLIDLPLCTTEPLEPALAIDPGEVRDIELLRANSWSWVDPARLTATPDDYQAFVQHSKGEFGLTKSGYVHSACGWFSDRSACYLASGRPVVAQDTGFSRYLPAGEGLLAFDSLRGAVDAMERVAGNYPFHARRAREIAEDCLRSDLVLGRLLDQVASPVGSRPPVGAHA
jgi:hypothetical protein